MYIILILILSCNVCCTVAMAMRSVVSLLYGGSGYV